MPRPRSERLSAPRVVSHLGVMLVVSVVLGVVVSGLMIPFAGLVGFTTDKVSETMDDLPTALETTDLPQKTKIVDRQGNLIAQLYDQNRINVSLTQVSRTMVKALVAIEDYRFYEHGALDIKGTVRAFLTNAANDGNVVQGGSSITQQLVKLTLLQEAKTKEEIAEVTDDSYARKLRELRYAIALEQEHTKDWILERYLNTAYFGDGAYGIQSAARHYFDVNAKQLNLNQSAILAGLVQNPTAYDPTNSPDRARDRRDVVLDRMAELNVIPQNLADGVKAKGLALKTQPANNGCVNSQAPFFCDYVVRYLIQDKQLGKTAKIRRERLYTAGLTIRTTVDLGYQEAADTAVQNHTNPEDKAIGGLALVEPGTGEVKAVAQSRPMGAKRRLGETYLNYTVPTEYGDANGFQAGSTFKAFVLAAAIEQGVPLNQAINVPARLSKPESDFTDCGGGPYGYGTWDVGNYDGVGRAVNLYSGTRLSVNTFFALLEAETGLCEPFKLANKMGVRLTNPTGAGAERIPSFTLGVADVSPLEMAEAYATFAARGLHCDARPVLEIRDAARNVIRDYPKACQQVMEATTADAVNDILRGVIEGGFASEQALDQPAAGKTGTTQDGKAVWFVGYTPQMAAAAMIAGVDDVGKPEPLDGKVIGGILRSGASGSAFAAPIWGDLMKVVDDDYEAENFVYPSTVPGAGVTVVAPPPKPDRGGGRGNGGDGGNGGNGNGNGNGEGRGNDDD